MKMLRNALHHNNLISTSVAATLAIILAVTFWFASSPKVSAVDCTLCHKRTLTITVVCGSDDYRRHLDHGDTMGACTTPTGNQ
jgi:hypothetical protein